MEHQSDMIYTRMEERLSQLISETEFEILSWNSYDQEAVDRSESTLDTWDYCFSIAIGLISPFISTNDKLQDYLKEIHNAASEATGEYDFLQEFLGKLLHHKGDPIDKPEKNFIKRDRENAWVLFHRLLWGHDVFSVKEDNPFFLMVKKMGFSGIVQAVQHLLADTTSKQGLPFPGSSYLDFRDENGNLSNYLISISQKISMDTIGTKRLAQDIYSHMFTIRAADMLGKNSISILNGVYLRVRRIKDRIRQLQFSLISFTVGFWIQALVGEGKLSVPYINIPVGKAMISSFIALYSENAARTRNLIKKGQVLALETDRLTSIARSDFSLSVPAETIEDAKEKIKHGQNNALSLVKMWEEEFTHDKC